MEVLDGQVPSPVSQRNEVGKIHLIGYSPVYLGGVFGIPGTSPRLLGFVLIVPMDGTVSKPETKIETEIKRHTGIHSV